MISVSRAAGYGKFTQTNDSHLPEARDTIERGGVMREGEEKEERKAGDHWEGEEEEEVEEEAGEEEHSLISSSRRVE